MFLRKKKVKDKHYLYAVENKWKKGKGVKQKVKKYLGRVHKFREPASKKIGFRDFLEMHYSVELGGYLDETESRQIISDLVKWELYKKGFGFDGNKGKVMKRKKESVVVNLDKTRKMLCYNGRSFAIESNGGYINNLSVTTLINYKLKDNGKWEGDLDKRAVGLKLARMFVDGGIKIPDEVFVAVFEKKFLE